MSSRSLLATAAVAFGLVASAPGLAQSPDDPLPDNPGKEVVIRVCTACHEASQFANARLTPEAWDNEISKMISAGAEMTGEDQAAVAAYLARNFSVKPTP